MKNKLTFLAFLPFIFLSAFIYGQNTDDVYARFYVPSFKVKGQVPEIKDYMVEEATNYFKDELKRVAVRKEEIDIYDRIGDLETIQIILKDRGVIDSVLSPIGVNLILLGEIYFSDVDKKVYIKVDLYSRDMKKMIGFGTSSSIEFVKFRDVENIKKLSKEAFCECFKNCKMKKVLKILNRKPPFRWSAHLIPGLHPHLNQQYKKKEGRIMLIGDLVVLGGTVFTYSMYRINKNKAEDERCCYEDALKYMNKSNNYRTATFIVSSAGWGALKILERILIKKEAKYSNINNSLLNQKSIRWDVLPYENGMVFKLTKQF